MNRGALLGGLAVGAAGAVALAVYDPFTGPAVACPLHALTGLHCPGCGATRALWLLVHGEPARALAHNVLLLPALGYIVARWWHAVAPAATSWLPGFVRAPAGVRPGALRALAVALVVFATARNLPALDFLAPPDPG
jgi:hypothetical protein